MPMTGAGLGAAIKAKMDALSDPSSDDIYTALGEAVIEYIEANASISVTVSDVTSGVETADGTGTIT